MTDKPKKTDESRKRHRLPIFMAVFWGVAIVVTFIAAIANPKEYYLIWSRFSTVFTVIYGLFFYCYNVYIKGKNILSYAVVMAFVALSFTIIWVAIEIPDVKRWKILYDSCDKLSFMVLCLFFMIADYVLYISEKDTYWQEGQFFALVDVPTFCAFLVILAFGYLAGDTGLINLEYFLSGANAFQLVAFNTSFTILLFKLSSRTAREGLVNDKK